MIAYVNKNTMINIIYPLLVVSYINIESLNLSFISYQICIILMFCFNRIRSHKMCNKIYIYMIFFVGFFIENPSFKFDLSFMYKN